MKLDEKKLKIIKWTARILAVAVLIFALPFYFGYGLPLPSSTMSFIENFWLAILPLIFIGLGLGWKYEKIAGYLITILITVGLILGVIIERELLWFMLVPLLSGIGYLIVGYNRR